MSQATPWWDSLPHKLQLCRAVKENCQFKEICHRECRYENGEDGLPRRTCTTKCEVLKRCAGRTEWESLRTHKLQEEEEAPFAEHSGHPFSEMQSQTTLPVEPQVGDQWEEFLRYALELQRKISQDSGVSLQPEPSQQRQSVMEAPHPKQSVLNRLLRRQPPATGTKYNFAKLWKDYAAFGSIEEV